MSPPRRVITLNDIFARCEPIPFSGCWVWTGPDNGKENWLAHGKIWFDGALRYVHRVVWYLVHGRWPAHVVHHKCYVRMCCNPDHLSDVTPSFNYLDGAGPKQQAYLMQNTIEIPDGVDPFELVD